MPAKIDANLCDGCRGSPEPPCVRSCPGDIVAKDFNREKAYLRCTGECWDCYACVKACPRNAIQVELPYAISRRVGRLVLVDHGPRGVLWEVRWPRGDVTRALRPGHLEPADLLPEVPEAAFLGKDI